ncbi:Flp pilus assembly protein CpaB [Vibrio sp. ZSDZ34]|uniref:Flp pilus assembly protein CpaB n=1 Tax=Vibrio gelatinilyticus TaxID=2893468 RepID=A0A9X1WDD0_9VIBR|nr:Flp pilus assembly protein CpaB [Vibrio gelatinilyticus]MCJ2377108.1 Flp pilus assembly protein CpaB [Vibrio gelatinilyticus]
MSKSQVFLLMLLSIVLGLTAVFFAKQWMDQQTQPEIVQEVVERLPVVVAEQEIPAGTIVEAAFISLRLLEKDWVDEDTLFLDQEEVIGKVASATMYSGEVVHKSRVSVPGEGSTLASIITEDKRAVTIRVNDVIGVAGFLLPGNRVDIMKTTPAGKNSAYTRTVLKNIKVLAVDQTARTKENKPVIVRAVTVEVTPREAATLLSANSSGKIQLALRNPQQKDPPPPKSYVSPSVTIIKGTQSSNIRVKD